jgi:hypothetical protein
MIETPPFWVVWSPTGRPPVYQHETIESAGQEAERMARANPGSEFYVLQPTSRVIRQDVQVTRFRSGDEVPF